jgi:tetratricopeptide (TPR) repeat protein
VTKIGERGPRDGGAVYCEVEGVASEVSAESLRHEGLFIPTPEPLPLDREVDLFLRSEAGEIELRGLVVQVIDCAEATAQRRSPGFGVLFLDLKESQRAWIARTRSAAEPQRRASSALAETQPLRPPQASTRGAQSRAPAAVAPAPAALAPAPEAVAAAPAALSGKTSSSTRSVEDAIERARATRKTGTTTLRTSARAQLEAQLATLKARSPSEILGLSAPHTVEAAHQAFLALAKRFHPHVYARLDSPEITRLATELFIIYKRAYDAIRAGTKDGASAKSAANNPRITLSGTRAPVSSSMRPADANALKGPQPTSSMRPVAAAAPTPGRAPISSLRPVAAASGGSSTPSRAPGPRTSLQPNADPATRRIADAELLLSSAVRHLAATRFEQADLDLAKAATLAPERVDIAVWRYLSRARGHKAGGRHEEARSSYRKVLELDPQHREAREHVDPPERRRGGLMGKWLGGDDE